LRVRSGLPDKFNNNVETFERMVDQDVLHPDGRKTISAHFADPFGIPRIVWRELQVGPVIDNQLRKLRHSQNAVIQNDVGVLGSDFTRDEFPQVLRCAGLHTQPDNPASPPLLQQDFEFADQVFGFFLNLDIAVSDDTEQTPALFLVAGEQIADEQIRSHPRAG
jgi:hypothetical protein